jgi:hypothetical protein
MSENRRAPLTTAIAAALLAGFIATAAEAGNGGTKNDGLDTPADTIHPDIHQNNNAGNNANPNAANAGGGNMHGIGNVPGQGGGDQPSDGAPGFADSLNTVHGGIGSKNKNAPPPIP